MAIVINGDSVVRIPGRWHPFFHRVGTCAKRCQGATCGKAGDGWELCRYVQARSPKFSSVRVTTFSRNAPPWGRLSHDHYAAGMPFCRALIAGMLADLEGAHINRKCDYGGLTSSRQIPGTQRLRRLLSPVSYGLPMQRGWFNIGYIAFRLRPA